MFFDRACGRISSPDGRAGRQAAGGIKTKANSAQLSWDWGSAWQKKTGFKNAILSKQKKSHCGKFVLLISQAQQSTRFS
jgi:hypothetical protein